jgi:hypothetical protein
MCFTPHSNDVTSWQNSSAEKISCNVMPFFYHHSVVIQHIVSDRLLSLNSKENCGHKRMVHNYFVMTSYHWNVRQNILTWRWWMNDKITWRYARIVPTLFLPLFHWMSIHLGQFVFYCFSTFCQLNFFFSNTRYCLKFNKRFVFEYRKYSTWPHRHPRHFPIMHHYTS